MKRPTQINALLLLSSLLGLASAALAQPECNNGASMNIVAHEDDDILFLSPDLIHDIQNGRCVRTVFVTAGDANLGLPYSKSRANGARSAYAQMARVLSPQWAISDASIPGHPIPVYTLQSHSKISLVFLKLPDGNFYGEGFSNNNYQSLQKLLAGTIYDIRAIDGSNKFTKLSLQSTLLKLIRDYRPDEIRTQDTNFVVWDHSDHRAVASLVESANMRYTTPHTFVSYIDYIDLFYAQNIFGADLFAKEMAFKAYAKHDSEIGCYTCFYNPYFYWLKRQYISNSSVR
jgi:LmbE family N-acetylglucosaminyl deacetylase